MDSDEDRTNLPCKYFFSRQGGLLDGEAVRQVLQINTIAEDNVSHPIPTSTNTYGT